MHQEDTVQMWNLSKIYVVVSMNNNERPRWQLCFSIFLTFPFDALFHISLPNVLKFWKGTPKFSILFFKFCTFTRNMKSVELSRINIQYFKERPLGQVLDFSKGGRNV